MTLPVTIRGQNGTGGVIAEVTSRGQLITAPIDYSSAFIASVAIANQAYNLVPPKPEKLFVITDVILTGRKDIGTVTDSTVIIYEADTDVSITSLKTLIQVAVPRSTAISITGLNVITTNVSAYVNVKTDDATIECTLMGYYLGHHHTI